MFTKNFRCCSHKYLYGKGAAVLVDTFLLDAGDGIPCLSKVPPYAGKTFFVVDNSSIELPGSKLKIWGKARILLTHPGKPK